MNSYDVVTIGSAVLDIFMRSDKFRVVKTDNVPGGVAMCEVYGGKMEVENVEIVSGGGATNVAVSLARKELKTAAICEMGNDPQSLIVHKELEEAGVDTRFVVQEPDETTAVSVILIAEDGGRSIMVYRGASSMLTRKDLPLDQFAARWLHISSLGGNMKLLAQILKFAKDHKIRVSLNPGMTEIKHKQELRKLLAQVEVLFINREEAGQLFEFDTWREKVWTHEVPTSEARVTVITDAERGGKAIIEGKPVFWQGKKVAKIVDTTGAGDAFASGYVAAILYGHNYERAINWGVENAASILKSIGAKEGLLSLSEIKNA